MDIVELKKKYKYNLDFIDGLAVVMDFKDKYGFVNEQGEEVIPCKYKDVFGFDDGLCIVRYYKNNFGIIDKQGNDILKGRYKQVGRFLQDGFLAPVLNMDDKYGYIDRYGNEFIACKYKSADVFNEGVGLVRDFDDNEFFIDQLGSKVSISEEKNNKYLDYLCFIIDMQMMHGDYV